LDVATAQATSGRCTLQQCFLALPDLSLKACALLNACNGCLLGLLATQAKQCLLLLQCRRSGCSVRL
jgi:hypothetical protein